MNERREGFPPGDAPAATGQKVLKPGGGKFRQQSAAARPSERLRDGDTPKSHKKARRESMRLDTSKFRAEKSNEKLGAAREGLSHQKPRKTPGLIKKAGKAARRGAWAYTHGKIYQAEHENVGIEAAHRTELAGEGAVRGGSRFVKRRARTAPARRVRRWEKKDVKARADFSFRTMAKEHPELKQNAISRYFQKSRIKKQYQKQARDAAKKAAQKAGASALSVTEKAAQAIAGFASRHPAGILIALLCFLIIMLVQSCMGSALTLGGGAMGGAGGSSYLAGDAEIERAELAYTEWETDLELEALAAQTSHPGYDEYRFDIAETGHDPHALLAFLTAKYDDFTFAGVEAALRDIFEQQYRLTFTETVEERTRLEKIEYPDPITGEMLEYEYEVPYDYRILNVVLAAKPFGEVIGPLLTTQDEQERYAMYAEIKGNRQYVGSPFPFDWLPDVSSYYGYRVHPINGEKDYHTGADIALPEGTEILAGADGVVVEAGNEGSYGLSVLVDYGGGITARYAHCSALLVSAGQGVAARQAIALVGNTGNSTGPHLHLEVLKDGEHLNPLYFAVIPFDE